METPRVLGLAVAIALLAGLGGTFELGFRRGRSIASGRGRSEGGQLGASQGAMLGLLALLLAFSFAGASQRFLDRQNLITKEANDIRTAYLRADLLDEPHASALRTALTEYTRHRITSSNHLADVADVEATLAEVSAFHDRMWIAARDGSLTKPPSANLVCASVNDVIAVHSQRMCASRRHLPDLVLALLVGASLLSMAALGLGCGLNGSRMLSLHVMLVLLVAATLWTTIDLDHPRIGFIRLSDLALRELRIG